MTKPLTRDEREALVKLAKELPLLPLYTGNDPLYVQHTLERAADAIAALAAHPSAEKGLGARLRDAGFAEVPRHSALPNVKSVDAVFPPDCTLIPPAPSNPVAERGEAVAWEYAWPDQLEPELHRERLSENSREARKAAGVTERALIYALTESSPETVVVPRETVRRVVAMLQTAYEVGLDAHWEDGTKTPNARICCDTAGELALLLAASPGAQKGES